MQVALGTQVSSGVNDSRRDKLRALAPGQQVMGKVRLVCQLPCPTYTAEDDTGLASQMQTNGENS